MDEIAQDPSTPTPPDRAERARVAYAAYTARYPASEIPDLIADLLHLADMDVVGGATDALDRAEKHYASENGAQR